MPAAGLAGKALRVVRAAKIAEGGAKPTADVVTQLGGPYWQVRKLKGFHAHHMPADIVSPMAKDRGPSIAMSPADHAKTASYGFGPQQLAFRAKQKKLIDSGDLRGAFDLDVADIRQKLGSKYDDAIQQASEHLKKLGY